MEEVTRLTVDLEERERRLKELEERQRKAEADARVRTERERELHRKQRADIERIGALERELDTKDTLLRNKSDELTRACHKHYELEQELAFYKIDAKFDTLGTPPVMLPADLEPVDGTGESPYIGKGRMTTVRRSLPQPAADSNRHSQLRDSGTSPLPHQNGDATFEEKRHVGARLDRQIEQAEHRLSSLHAELRGAEAELEATRRAGAPDPGRSQLRDALARKLGRVTRLQEDAQLLRCQMDETEADVRRQQSDVDILRHQLTGLHGSEPQYAALQKQMVDKGQQLSDQNDAYSDLQAQLQVLHETIQKEAEEIKELERRLQDGLDDGLRKELEGVVEGLQDYLVNMRQEANQQKEQLNVTLRERDHLQRELADSRQETSEELQVEKASRQDIVRRLTRLEAELDDARADNSELRAELQSRDEEEEDRLQEVEQSERQIGDLRGALRRLKEEAESERVEMEAALAAERRRARARSGAAKDQTDAGSVQRELEGLRRANAQLQRQLEAQRQQLLSPEDVSRQVRDIVTSVRQSKPLNASPPGDVLSRSLGELASVLEGRAARDMVSGAATPGAKSDAEVHALRSKLEQAEREESRADQSAQAEVLLSMIEDSKRTYSEEMGKMKDQIGRLQDALESVRVRPSQTLQLQSMLSNVEEEEAGSGPSIAQSPNLPGATSPPRQRLFTRTRPRRGGDTSGEEEEGERRGPGLLPWKKSMYDTLSSDEQGMFEELNTELGRLRRQMDTIEASNADKLEGAMDQIQSLQSEIKRRDEQAKLAERDRERSEWEEQLNATFAELDQAQGQIMTLQRDLDERQRDVEMAGQDKSNDRIHLQEQEIDQLKTILDAQRHEIARLNDLLDRLSGLNPAEANRLELERIQADIGALRANVASQNGAGRVPAWGQPTAARASPFVGAQGFVSPQPAMQPFAAAASPLHPFSASPAVGYSSPHLTSSLPTMVMAEDVHDRRRRLSSGERHSLICNVPEHHRLEDYLQGLQDKVAGLKRRLKEKRRADHDQELVALRSLRLELEKKKDELEEAQLSLERHRAAAERLKQQEGAVVDAARLEVERLKAEAIRARREVAGAQRAEALEEAEAELEAKREEMDGVEESLSHRRADLAHVQKQLSAANSELQEVKAEARETISRYDEARLGHERTVQEAEELERRVKEALTELARSTNDARELRAEVLELEGSKRGLELTLNEVQLVIGKKDSEFQALNQAVQQTSEQLSKLQQDLAMTMEQGREKLDLIQEEEALLSARRSELSKVQQDVEQERAALEQLDRRMGTRRTEEQLLGEEVEKRRAQLAAVAREVEQEAGARQREAREVQNTLESLREEKKHLLKTIEDHRSERAQLREDADREQQVLQNITSAISKQKLELKHLLEMVKMEQAELGKVNEQYADRLAALERAQASLHDQRAELSQIEASRKVKVSELERCREALANESAALERAQSERRSAEVGVEVAAKEKDMLAENARALETRQAALKKSVAQLDENLFSAQSRLDKLQAEVGAQETALSRVRAERATLEKDLSQLQGQVREARAEWKSLRDRLGDYETKAEKAESEWRQRLRQRDDLQVEVRRLGEQARAGQVASEEAAVRAASCKQDLQRATMELNERETERQEASKNLSRVRCEIEEEECRLNRLLSNSASDLERVKRELAAKEEEVQSCSSRLNQLKRESDQRQVCEDRSNHLARRCADLEAESRGSTEQQQQLAEALNRSLKERQALRDELAKERDLRMGATRGAEETGEELRRQLTESQRELMRVKKRCATELRDLEKVAQQHCSRSNRLSADLNQARLDYLQLRKQLMSQAELDEKKRRLEQTLQALKHELGPTENGHASEDLPGLNGTALEELCDLHDQRQLLQSHLETLKENLQQIRASSSPAPSPLPASQLGLDADEELVKTQIRQRVNAHIDSLSTQCRRSESNMHNLRRRLDDLESVLGKDSASPTRDRSPFHEISAEDPRKDV